MAGLNDNYFLADDSMEKPVNPIVTVDAFKDNQEGEEAPELRDDIDMIAVATESLSIALRSVELFKHRIRDAGGISQTVALEAHSYIPSLITEDRSKEYYTKYPSKTLYNTALEDADKETKSIVTKFVEALVSMFKRIADWIKSFFSKSEVANVTKPEAVALLEGYHETVTDLNGAAQAAEPIVEKSVQEQADKIAAFKAKLDQIAEDKAIAEKAAKLEELGKYAATMKSNYSGSEALVGELNSMLGRLPHVRRFLGNLTDVSESVYSYGNFASSLNSLLQSVNKHIASEDYEGLKKLLDSDDFSNTKKSIEGLSLGMVAFKSLPPDYTIEAFEKFRKDITNKVISDVIEASAKLAKSGIGDNEALVKTMGTITESVAQMASYKWSDQEGQAKEFLEALRDLNKNTLIPYAQSISMAYSVTAQLVAMIKGLDTLVSKLNENIQRKVRDAIVAKAKELGFSADETKRFV